MNKLTTQTAAGKERLLMSDLTPSNPRTPEEKRARKLKIRHLTLDLMMPAVAAIFLILTLIWPGRVFASLTGISSGIVLIRFSQTRYKQPEDYRYTDRLAFIAGVVLIILSVCWLGVLILMAMDIVPNFLP